MRFRLSGALNALGNGSVGALLVCIDTVLACIGASDSFQQSLAAYFVVL